MDKPLVSFFFATLNRKDVVQETLEKLHEQEYRPIEIIVADNCSTDGTPEMIEKQFPGVKLLRLTRNHGAIAARNIACANSKGKYVVSIDDDSFPGKEAIVRMVSEFEKDEKLGLVVFDIYNYDAHIKHYHDEAHIPDERQSIEKYNWSGCGGAYRREIFETHGYWEEWGRQAPFESSVSAKAMLMGYTGKQFSDIYVFHHWSPVGDSATFRRSEIADITACRSTLFFAVKFFPMNSVTLIFLFKLAWITVFHVFDTWRFTLLKGWFSGWLKVHYVMKERIPLSQQQVNNLSISLNAKGR